MPGFVGYDTSDNLLNPTRGFRIKANASPETSVRGRARPYARLMVEGTAYYPVSSSIVIAGRDGLQDSVNQVGQEMTRRNLNIQPTLTERPGLPVRIIVNRDLVLRPYQPLFFNRGTSR